MVQYVVQPLLLPDQFQLDDTAAEELNYITYVGLRVQ